MKDSVAYVFRLVVTNESPSEIKKELQSDAPTKPVWNKEKAEINPLVPGVH